MQIGVLAKDTPCRDYALISHVSRGCRGNVVPLPSPSKHCERGQDWCRFLSSLRR